MANVLITQKISDWSEFERHFRQDSHRRRILGSQGARVFRDVDDPTSAYVVFEWESTESADKFVAEWEATMSQNRLRVAEEAFELDA